jgi:hypothetical protein
MRKWREEVRDVGNPGGLVEESFGSADEID